MATGSPAYEPPLKTFEPTAMNVPHSAQKMRSGGLGESQSQQVTLGSVGLHGGAGTRSGVVSGGNGPREEAMDGAGADGAGADARASGR